MDIYLIISLILNVFFLYVLNRARKQVQKLKEAIYEGNSAKRAAIRKADRMSQMVQNLHNVAKGE